jgi:hypothetical protein
MGVLARHVPELLAAYEARCTALRVLWFKGCNRARVLQGSNKASSANGCGAPESLHGW